MSGETPDLPTFCRPPQSRISNFWKKNFFIFFPKIVYTQSCAPRPHGSAHTQFLEKMCVCECLLVFMLLTVCVNDSVCMY